MCVCFTVVYYHYFYFYSIIIFFFFLYACVVWLFLSSHTLINDSTSNKLGQTSCFALVPFRGQFWLWSESEIITLIAFTKCSTFSRRNWPIIPHFKMLDDGTVLLLANYLSQHDSAYTVVRAMCQVNGGWSFSATWGSETPEPIHLKSSTFDYVQSATPRAKYGGRRKWGVVWAYWWSYTLACIF